MPSFVVHGVVPLLFLLALRRLDAKKIWILWPLTFLPDADYFFGFHRATTGNVFVLLPFLAALVYALWPPRRDWALAEWMGIALVYLGSHLLMDVFTGGTVLLYPFSTYNYCFNLSIWVYTATNTLEPNIGFCSAPGIPTVSPIYPWLSYSEGAILAFLVPAGLAAGIVQLHRRGHLGKGRKGREGRDAPAHRIR